jgi:hypothetical protein
MNYGTMRGVVSLNLVKNSRKTARESLPCPDYVYVLRNKHWRCLVEVEEKLQRASITFFGDHKEYEAQLDDYNEIGGKELKKKNLLKKTQ